MSRTRAVRSQAVRGCGGGSARPGASACASMKRMRRSISSMGWRRSRASQRFACFITRRRQSWNGSPMRATSRRRMSQAWTSASCAAGWRKLCSGHGGSYASRRVSGSLLWPACVMRGGSHEGRGAGGGGCGRPTAQVAQAAAAQRSARELSYSGAAGFGWVAHRFRIVRCIKMHPTIVSTASVEARARARCGPRAAVSGRVVWRRRRRPFGCCI